MNITEALTQIEKNFPEAAQVIRAERDAIAKSISVTLEDGTAPDNLVIHVKILIGLYRLTKAKLASMIDAEIVGDRE